MNMLHNNNGGKGGGRRPAVDGRIIETNALPQCRHVIRKAGDQQRRLFRIHTAVVTRSRSQADITTVVGDPLEQNAYVLWSVLRL